MNTAAISYGAKPAAARRFRRLREIAAFVKLGVRYRRAAERDEKNGFQFAAAMEWRKAAELFSPIPQVSDRCWQEWERIMHLPRRFAGPIGESAEVRPQYSLKYDHHETTKAVVGEVPVALPA